ncbi:concanavalin A-like lectin/glucanase [Choiromyces venosus 120613-1]|uniref:Concanavalin A-like lectin/glucanase n=1 Tax=Choiromyces venosus 120613-1 TaxID=1336337 RepID=A0A3N4JA47_9PEZI|nr:concanavalin A-like lectin/glucanase [Choiromyces venosus 120613-1]
MTTLWASLLLIALGFIGGPVANADCECGYSLNSTVFTDLIESDFTFLKNITQDTDWVVQEWKVDKEASKGPYGRKTQAKNVISNPSIQHNVSATGVNGDPAGLELFVRELETGEDHIGVAEVDSRRTDIIYGTFRAGIKATGVNGTCGAFFWYLNDTQEIDIEFLSSQITPTSSPVNLVLHSLLTQERGGDAKNTPTYKVVSLPFATDGEFHEYRFDWQPDKVSFYSDGSWLGDMTDSQYIPKSPGKIILSHWSNGNPLWSGGPPEVDAKMTVSYVQGYFNSSLPSRREDYKKRCKDRSAPNAICPIPEQKGPPKVGTVHFFSQNAGVDKTPNQTVYAKNLSKSLGRGLAAGMNCWMQSG